MKEHPILMSAPMVRAILAGTKTQTRRVVKPQPEHPKFVKRHMLARDDEGEDLYLHSSTLPRAIRCPYGGPGDRLWVRETWARDSEDGTNIYRADLGAGGAAGCDADSWERMRVEGDARYRWRPSIHMPRWASRITLEVTVVRVERLQDISEGDAIAEGVSPSPRCLLDDDTAAFNRIGPVMDDSFPIARYAVLWESINGPASWEANPWVWVVEFRRAE